ncbi:hypothetical protein GH810_09555 [Acetobacterium paludosum]|uniref:Uncharacterized protein n=1 Tax=Acetobacterium paludosum TaxID=52693 RepID=A0A923HWP2_9FIRM|nr:hypothetical protein [Acetobacterium paludosum]MBC3888552.1 hypothetical protein [Acetobacterium paludosum]
MKAYKYSIFVTLALTVFSIIAIFAFDDVFFYIPNDQIKNFISHNMDNFDSLFFGIFTGSLVSLIVAAVSYSIEKRRLTAAIWNSSRKLVNDFKLLLVDNIDFDQLTKDSLLETIKRSEFNHKVRDWKNYHRSPYSLDIMDLDFILGHSKMAQLMINLQKNIAHLSLVVDGFMNAFLNDKLENAYGDVDIEKLFAVITSEDEQKLVKTTERYLDDIVRHLKK